MMKFKNKALISLAGIATIGAPIATVISCGTTKIDLTIGIRPEDQNLWTNIAKEFKKATGKTIGFKWVQDQNNDYTLWSSQGNMPDVTIADSGWAKTGIERKWFQSLDLKDIAENAKYRITGTSPAYAEDPNLKFDKTYFDKGSMDMMKTQAAGYNALSVIYGPKLTFMWKKLPTANGTWENIMDGQTELKWYVPKTDGTVESVTSFDTATKTTGSDTPLRSLKDNHILKNNLPDIQEFLARATSKNDMKFNLNLNSINLDATTPAEKVIATGTMGYNQRMASVSKVLYDVAKQKNVSTIKAGSIDDPSTPWDFLAYGDSMLGKIPKNKLTNMDDHNVLKDQNVFSNQMNDKWNFKSTTITKTNLSKQAKLAYLAKFGYFTNNVVGTTKTVDSNDDKQISFASGKTAILRDGALWQWNGMKEKIHHAFPNAKMDDVLTSIGTPIQITGNDGYAVTKTLSGQKLELAKKFMRFMMQKKAAADITGSKAVSVMIKAQKLQDTSKMPLTLQNGLNTAGDKYFKLTANSILDKDRITGIPFTLAKSSTTSGTQVNGYNNDPIYDPYFDYWMKGPEFDHNHNDLNRFLSAYNKYNKKYMDMLKSH